MNTLVRLDPFTEVTQLRNLLDRSFGDFAPWNGRTTSELGYVPFDLSEDDAGFRVVANLPGVKPEDVNIQLHGDTVTITGEMKAESVEEKKSWHLRERRHGSFSRSFTLPTAVDSDQAEAAFEYGVLRLSLPKSEAARPKTIKVTATA